MVNTGQSFQLTELRSMPKIKEAVSKAPILLTDKGIPQYVFMSTAQFEDMQKEIRYLKKLVKEDVKSYE